MGQSDPDVLIVGAGPAGMTLAAALSRHGVSFRIVDKDTEPAKVTRAPVLWSRTQEILAALGILDLWLPESDSMREESLHFYGKAAGVVPTLAANSPYPKARFCGQNVTERLLDQHLTQVGHPVEYGQEAISYEEGAGVACVAVRNADGAEEIIRAKWVVSAEGAHSLVRKAVGLDYEGEKYIGYRIHIADVIAHWTIATPVGQTFFMVEEQAYMGGQRLPGDPDRFYFYILTRDERPEDPSNEVSLEDVQQLVRKLSGDGGATLSDPQWLNTARYKHGVAEAYRKGRAMLIGDAARSAPPLYGQGMNYAMHDAWNLAWKLAFVVKGLGPETLLDTFADERRKLGLELDARIDRTFRFITEPKPLQSTLTRALAPLFLSNEHLTHSYEQQFTEMDISYAGVGLNATPSSLGKLKAGERAPALWVKRLPDCTLTNVLDLYDGLKWTLLVIASAGEEEDKTNTLLDYARSTQSRYSDRLRAVLLSAGPQRPNPLTLDTLVDAEARFLREQDLPKASLLLVRPDGYIALTARHDTEEVTAYLHQWVQVA